MVQGAHGLVWSLDGVDGKTLLTAHADKVEATVSTEDKAGNIATAQTIPRLFSESGSSDHH